jgi:hypothetical protein
LSDSEDAEVSRDVLAAALEANRELTRLAGELREENTRLRAENAPQTAELEKLHQRLLRPAFRPLHSARHSS